MKIPLQSKPLSFNQLPPYRKVLWGKPCLLIVRVTAATEQYTGLNCINSDNNDNLAPKTNLTCLYHSSIPRRVHAIHILDFLDTQFSSNCHFYICSPLALKIHNVIGNMLEKCCVIFVPFFWTTRYVYVIINKVSRIYHKLLLL